MKRSRTIALLAFVLVAGLIVFVAACGGGDSIVGKWDSDMGLSFEFKADGSMVLSAMDQDIPLSYTAEDGTLKIMGGDAMGIPAEIKYKVSGDTMTMTSPDGEEEKLQRAK